MPRTWTDFDIDLSRCRGTGVEVKTLCPKCSHTRKKSTFPCLNVNTEKGVWNCWHCGWGGSLQYGEERVVALPKRYHKPVFQEATPTDKMLSWFQARGIPASVVLRRKITTGMVYMPQVEEEVRAIMFPYFRNGEVVNIKYRDANKNFRMVAGAERILYGLDDVQGDTILITEGECDAMALEVAGYTSVVSVPDGAPAADSKNYEHKFDFLTSAETWLTPIKRIILAVDNDAPGKRLAEELSRRLGPERCYTVQWSSECKDANEVLMLHGASVLKECIEYAEPWPVKGIAIPSGLSDGLERIYAYGMQRGLSTGWPELDKLYTVRPGEFTMVSGIPGHGKSAFLSAMAVNMMQQHGWRFTMFSPENYPLERYLASLTEIVTGKPFDGAPSRVSLAEMRDARDTLLSHVSFIMPEDDSPTLDWLLGLAKVQVYREGIKGLILDPWNEIEHSRPANLTETEYISQSLTKIRQFARRHHVHVWIVVHPTKMAKATAGDFAGHYPPPTPYDAHGSSHWRNKADNCLCVWRDVESSIHATTVFIQKIRFRENGTLGDLEMRFHPSCGRFEVLRKLEVVRRTGQGYGYAEEEL